MLGVLFEKIIFNKLHYLNKSSENFNYYNNWNVIVDIIKDFEIFGQLIYVNFNLHFLIVGLMLFLSIIRAVVLTHHSS